MADLPYIQQRQEVSVTGQDSIGDQVNYVSADANGNMFVKDYADGPVTPGTVASVSNLIGGQFNTTLPTVANTQQSAIQLDSSGRILVSPNLLSDNNITGTISALNGNVAINSQGKASVIITVTGTWVANLQLQGFDGTNWVVTAGLTQPAGGITEALSTNGTVLVNSGGYSQIRIIATAYTSGTANIFMNAGSGPALVEVYNDSGNPLIVAGQGTAGSPGTSALTIQGIFGGTNVAVSQGTAANLQSTARLNDGSGNSLTSTNVNSKQALDVAPARPPLDLTGSGTIGALNATVVGTTQGCSSITFDVTGTWVATIVIEGTVGDGNWFIVNGDVDVTDTIASSFTSNTFVTIPCGSFTQVRLRASLYTSGTATVTWNSSAGIGIVEVFNTSPASLQAQVRVQDGSGNSINSINNQLQTRDVLNVAVQSRAQSVTTTAAEALGAAIILVNRKMLQITPTNGIIYYGATGVTTTTGTPIFPNNTVFLDVTDNVHIFVIAGATTDVRIIEYS